MNTDNQPVNPPPLPPRKPPYLSSCLTMLGAITATILVIVTFFALTEIKTGGIIIALCFLGFFFVFLVIDHRALSRTKTAVMSAVKANAKLFLRMMLWTIGALIIGILLSFGTCVFLVSR